MKPKYKIGDVVVTEQSIGVVTAIIQQLEQRPSVLVSGDSSRVVFTYCIGGNNQHTISENQIKRIL